MPTYNKCCFFQGFEAVDSVIIKFIFVYVKSELVFILDEFRLKKKKNSLSSPGLSKVESGNVLRTLSASFTLPVKSERAVSCPLLNSDSHRGTRHGFEPQ